MAEGTTGKPGTGGLIPRAKFPAVGKISPEFFDEVIYPRLGAARPEVVVSPQHGVDCGVVKIGDGRVMVVTTDPIFIVPEYGFERAAWFAWHILASDVTTSGFPPAYVIVDFNLPLKMTENQFATLWEVFDRESRKYGAQVITGHTARYVGTDYPMVGGATFIAVGPEDKYVHPGMAQPGDTIVVTKGAAIEATGIFACAFPETIRQHLGETVLREGQEIFFKMSTVDDAITAAGIGVREQGITAMHDATECGVIGGLFEIAQASRTGIAVDVDKVPVPRAAGAICKHFGMDPLTSISEGTLLIAVKQRKAETLLATLRARGIQAEAVGEILARKEGFRMIQDGQSKPLEHPRVDPFWPAMDRAMQAGLK
ncbi:MAG TPA: AIR synthase family protein [bacterium]|nr:AIR synthase family protein [bacterium]